MANFVRKSAAFLAGIWPIVASTLPDAQKVVLMEVLRYLARTGQPEPKQALQEKAAAFCEVVEKKLEMSRT